MSISRARDTANLGAQAGSGLDASDITTGVLPVGVTGGSGLTVVPKAGVMTIKQIGALINGPGGANDTQTVNSMDNTRQGSHKTMDSNFNPTLNTQLSCKSWRIFSQYIFRNFF